MIAPDDTTFAYLAGRPYAPRGADWERSVAHWRTLPSDAGAVFDTRSRRSTPARIAPMVTWGTSPQDVAPISGRVPDPDETSDARAPRGPAARARLHGPDAGHAADRHRDRPRLHRLLHEQPDRGPAGRRGDRRWPQRQRARAGVGGAGIGPGQGTGRGRGPRPHLHRGRLRVARGRLLALPRHQRRGRSRPASAAPRRRTATSSAVRGAARAPT